MSNSIDFIPVPPPGDRNPLRHLQETLSAQGEALGEMTPLLQELSAQILALSCAVHALVATHPKPQALLEEFQARMDRVADALPPKRIPLYREAVQQLQEVILAAANGAAAPPAPPSDPGAGR